MRDRDINAVIAELRESISFFDEQGVSRRELLAYVTRVDAPPPRWAVQLGYFVGRVVGLVDALGLLWGVDSSAVADALRLHHRRDEARRN